MDAIQLIPATCAPRSFRPEVEVQGDWSSNSLRFATESEAKSYAQDLYSRWMLCTGHRVVPCSDEPTHEWIDGAGLRNLNAPAGTPPRMPPRSVQL